MAASRPARPQPEPDRGGGPHGARGQPLPLHRLPQHRQGGPRGRQAPGGQRSRPAARGRTASRSEGSHERRPTRPPTRNGWVGRAMRRKEDPRMITGEGQLRRRHRRSRACCYMAVVRSPEAHAKIVSIDTSAAEGARPACIAVFTGEDLPTSPPRCRWPGCPPGVEIKTPEHWPLARGEVKHVGEPVAVVIGEDKYARRRRRRGGRRRVRPAAGRRRPGGGARGRRAARPRRVRHQRDARVVARRRRHRGRLRRGRRRSSSGGSSTTAPRARRSSRASCIAEYRGGRPHAARPPPDPAPRPLVPGRRARASPRSASA